MKLYSTKQLADLCAVSVRTLYHYEDIGLIKPTRNDENGYREYSEQDRKNVEQILHLQSFGFSLTKIHKLLTVSPGELVRALQIQKTNLEEKKFHIDSSIQTITNKIKCMQQHIKNSDQYDPSTDPDVKKYQSEAKLRWGDTDMYKQSMQRIGKMSKSEMHALKDKTNKFYESFVQLMELSPEHPDVQKMIVQHYNNLRTFYEPNLELYKGLAEMYVRDPRFKKYYEKYKKGFAQFMHDAMLVYVKNQKM